MHRLLLLIFSLFLLSSCADWKKAAEEGDRVEFDVDQPSGKGRKKPKTEEGNKVETPPKNYASILEKYAAICGVSVNALKNGALYEYIDGWIGVPYKFGGNTKDGVDCSGFVNAVFLNVFKQQLKRSATEMVNQCDLVDKEKLSEADLVFFDISGKNSHVGVYLTNNRFVHASTSKGVMVSELTQAYWVKYWGRAGRVRK